MNNFNIFKDLPLAKMANEISRMTYEYEETKVPSSHYKKILEVKTVEYLEEIIENSQIDTLAKQIKAIRDSNPKLFFQAMFALEMNLKIGELRADERYALETVTTDYLVKPKKQAFISNEYSDEYLELLDK